MPLSKAWRELHRSRFSELPLDCGNAIDPGVIYTEDLRDWSDKATTPDQRRIEQYIDRYDLTRKRILHIGIGNSGLARRFYHHVSEIVGTTIDEPEIEVGRSLEFPNYKTVLHNKFLENGEIHGRFDFILDNNPTSPCCCVRHLADLIDSYVSRLEVGGQFVTDLQGLAWLPDDANPRWSFSFEDLAAVGAAVGLSAFRANRKVCVLSAAVPAAPGYRSVSRHYFRRARDLPAKIKRKGRAVIARLYRKSIDPILKSIVPGRRPALSRKDR